MNSTGSTAKAEVEGSPLRIEPSLIKAFRGLFRISFKSQFAARRLPMVILLAFLIPALAWFTVGTGRQVPFFHWMVDVYLLLLLPLYCLSVCGALIRDEIQSDTLGFLTTRPLTRVRLFLVKFVCQIVLLEMIGLGSAVLLMASGGLRSIPDLVALAPVFLLAQGLGVLAYGALSSLLGLLTQRYMVLGIVYGFVVEFGIGRIPTNINNLSVSRHLRTILANNETILDLYGWSPEGTLFSMAILGSATVGFLVIGAVVFKFREYHASDDMQK
jgi:ABC-type transport system involved in multi-copper enzyme maturation permease subunit